MPAKFGAGQLIERVAFDQRAAVDDGYGNIVAGDWTEQFRMRAKFIYLRGSETVMAGRLESRESLIMQVRACADAKRIAAEWQARDLRRGTAYNIRTWGDAPSGSMTIGTVGSTKYATMRIVIYAGNEKTMVGNRSQFQLARIIEFGTQAMAQQPYFFPAWRTMKKRTRDRIKRSTKQAILRGA
jgi:head-tail adaptor